MEIPFYLCYRSDLLLFDFETMKSVMNWEEMMDYRRSKTKSRSSFCLFMTDVGRYAIFYATLKPLANSVTFGGSRTKTNLNLEGYQSIYFSTEAHGNNTAFKVVLRHNKLNYPHPSFEQKFQVCLAQLNIYLFTKQIIVPFFLQLIIG